MVKDREAWRATVPGGRRELDATERLNNKKSIKGALCDVIFKWKKSATEHLK